LQLSLEDLLANLGVSVEDMVHAQGDPRGAMMIAQARREGIGVDDLMSMGVIMGGGGGGGGEGMSFEEMSALEDVVVRTPEETIAQFAETVCKGEAAGDSEDSAGGSSSCCCSVCKEDYCTGDVLKRLPCEHQFHKDCVEQWLRMSRKCPICSQLCFDGGS
jgi:E3 ubiquitin-protein ligase Arkadia